MTEETTAYKPIVRCWHDGHFVHPKGRYGTFADGRDAQPCDATNDWGR